MILVAYVAGIVTPFVAYALLCAVVIATSRGSGTQCMVCDHLYVDIEDRRMRAYIWVRKAWHRVWWRPRRWHKAATAAYLAKWRRP